MALTHDDIRQLAGFRAADGPVVSLYLDVDGRRYPRPRDYEVQLDHLLRTADGHGGTAAGAQAGDLRLIESFVRAGIDRSRTRGLAVFSSAAAGLWRVIELPVPVRNQLTVNDAPQVRQLEALLDDNERFGVLLVDRQRTRLLVFELGELVDKSELVDELPRHEDEGGDPDRDQVRVSLPAHTHHHLRHAAQVAFHAHQQRPFDHLILSAPDDVLPELEHDLHAYLRERIASRLSLPVTASDSEIRQAVLTVEERVGRQRQAALVNRLRDAVGAGGPAWVSSGGAAAHTTSRPGVAGLDGVLAALGERRVDTLLVARDFVAPGWRCPGCAALAARGRRCGLCEAEMIAVDDVVEAAVEQALRLACRVVICGDNADLDVLGRVGALLRY